MFVSGIYENDFWIVLVVFFSSFGSLFGYDIKCVVCKVLIAV